MSLITLQEAHDHLKPPGSIDDARILRQMEEASQIVLNHIKLPEDSYQDSNLVPVDVPPQVRAAVLLVLGSLYDNADGQDPDKDPISPAVISLLRSRRTPTLA